MSPGERSYSWRKVPGEKAEGMESRAQMEIDRTARGTAPYLGWQAVSQECLQEGEGRASASRAWGSTEGEQSGEVERLLSRDRRATQGPGSDPSFIPAVCCSVT